MSRSLKKWVVGSGEWFAKIWGILQTRMYQRGNYMKINCDYFYILKLMLQTVRVEELDEKMASFHVSFLIYGP